MSTQDASPGFAFLRTKEKSEGITLQPRQSASFCSDDGKRKIGCGGP
jgi:hypothetical protein